MLQAELHGKLPSDATRSEDVLTSNVFGIMNNCDRSLFLKPWLELIGLIIDPVYVEQADFSFWPSFEDGTEPDVVIDMPGYFIVIEAKYLSNLGDDETQLSREIIQGLKEAKDKQFNLVCITSDFDYPQILIKQKNKYSINIFWTSWQKLYIFLRGTLQKEQDNSTKRWLSDLKELLENKGFMGFEGFRNIYSGEFMNSQQYLDKLRQISEQFSYLISELDSELKKLDFEHLIVSEDRIERDGTSRKLDSPHSWIPTYYGFAWTEKDLKSKLPDVVYFLKLWINYDNPKLWIGTFIFSDRSSNSSQSKEINYYMTEQIKESEFGKPTLNPHEIGIIHEKYFSVGSSSWLNREIIYYDVDIRQISEKKDIIKLVSMFKELRKKINLLDDKLSTLDQSSNNNLD